MAVVQQQPIDSNAISELKHLRPLWDDFLKHANRFSKDARLFLRTMSSFTDSLDAISQVAASTAVIDQYGRPLGKTLQAISSYQRSLEFKFRALQTAFSDRLLHRLSDQVSVWRSRTDNLDRVHSKTIRGSKRESKTGLLSLCKRKPSKGDRSKCLEEASKELAGQINGFFVCIRPVLQLQSTMASDFKRLSELVVSFDSGGMDAMVNNHQQQPTQWPPQNPNESRSSFFSSSSTSSSVNNTVVIAADTKQEQWPPAADFNEANQLNHDPINADHLNTSTCAAPTIWRRSSRYQQRLAPKPVAIPKVPTMMMATSAAQNHRIQSTSTSTSISGLTSTTVTDVMSNYAPASCDGGSVKYDRTNGVARIAGNYTDSIRSGPASTTIRRNVTSTSQDRFQR